MESAQQIIREASDFGRRAAAEKGLEVVHGETPTVYQRGIAAIHGREDAAACFYMLTKVLDRQRTQQRWINVMVFLLLCVLFKLS